MDTIKLVKKSKKGNNLAFSTLIKTYEKDLYRVAISMMKNEDDALDCIQETILQAYTNIKNLREDKYFKTWLIKILINNCNSLLNKRKKTTPLDFETLENLPDKNNDNFDLKYIVDELPEDLRLIVLLYYYEDLNISDISKSLDIPDGTVKSRLSRARNKLKDLLTLD